MEKLIELLTNPYLWTAFFFILLFEITKGRAKR